MLVGLAIVEVNVQNILNTDLKNNFSYLFKTVLKLAFFAEKSD